MDEVEQRHGGSGDNIGGNKITIIQDRVSAQKSKFLNAFAFYDLSDLIGRRYHLDAIHAHFEKHSFLLLHGIGGIGKTTLSRAYIARYQDEYDFIAYVEIVGTIAEAMIAQLGQMYEEEREILDRFKGIKGNDRFKDLIENLRHKTKLLLVLDDVKETSGLAIVWRQLLSLKAKILLVGRAHVDFSDLGNRFLEVRELGEDEAFFLFISHYKKAISEREERIIKKILIKSYNHPKLIEIIAKAARVNPFLELNSVLSIVTDRTFDHQAINFPVSDGGESRKIMSILLDLFDTSSLREDQKLMLCYFSVLPSIDISIHEFTTLVGAESEEDRTKLVLALNSLMNEGWLNSSLSNSYVMHGLIQWVARQQLIPSVRNCVAIIKGVLAKLDGDLTKHDKEKFFQYLLEITNFFKDVNDEIIEKCCRQLSTLYISFGDQINGALYEEKANNISTAVSSSDEKRGSVGWHAATATAYTVLGDYSQALIYHQKEYALLVEELPESHPVLSTSLKNLATDYEMLGDYEKALFFCLKGFAIVRPLLRSSDPVLLQYYIFLARLHKKLQNFREALDCRQKILNVKKVASRENALELADLYFNMGDDYLRMGDFERSLSNFAIQLSLMDAWELLDDELCAKGYHGTAQSLSALGLHGQAIPNLLRALTIYRYRFGLFTVVIADWYHQLAGMYFNQNMHFPSMAYYRLAFDIQSGLRLIGEIDLTNSFQNLETIYHRLELFEELEVLPQHAQKFRAFGRASRPYANDINKSVDFTFKLAGELRSSFTDYQQPPRIDYGVDLVSHGLAKSYSHIADTYRVMGSQQANEYALRIAEIERRNGDFKNQVRLKGLSHMKSAKTRELLGAFDESLKYLRNARSLLESLSDQEDTLHIREIDQKIEELETKSKRRESFVWWRFW